MAVSVSAGLWRVCGRWAAMVLVWGKASSMDLRLGSSAQTRQAITRGPRVKRLAAALAALTLAGGGLVASGVAATPAHAAGTSTVTKTFSPTSGGAQTWTVPAGVSSVKVAVVAGSGGNRAGVLVWGSGAGGKGAVVTATVPVAAGQSLQVTPGYAGKNGGGPDYGAGGEGYGNGGSSGWGGGGGGSSAVALRDGSTTTVLIVAGGGGGGGWARCSGGHGYGGGGAGGNGGSCDGGGGTYVADNLSGASYDTHEGDGSVTLTYDVVQADTVVDVDAVPDATVYGVPANFTVRVVNTKTTSNVESPTGTVTLSGDGVDAQTADLNDGVATFAGFAPSVGSHALTFNYAPASADADSFASSSASYTLVVAKAPTKIVGVVVTLGDHVGDRSVVSGRVVPTTAPVDGYGYALPTGKVAITSGSTDLGTVPIAVDGTFRYKPAWTVGTLPVTFTYVGDGNYAASVPVSTDVTIAPIATTSSLTLADSSIGQIEQTTATVKVTPVGTDTDGAAALPGLGGKVQVLADGVPAGDPVPLGADGTAQVRLPLLAPGVHNITVQYQGDATYAASESDAQVLTVEATPAGPVVPLTPTIPSAPAASGDESTPALAKTGTDANIIGAAGMLAALLLAAGSTMMVVARRRKHS